MATLLSTPPRLADGLGSKGIAPLRKEIHPLLWFPRILVFKEFGVLFFKDRIKKVRIT